MARTTFKSFLIDLYNTPSVEDFSIRVLTNEGDNAGFYELLNVICYGSNKLRELSFQDFVYNVFKDSDDRHFVGMIMGKPIMGVREDTVHKVMEYKVIV